MNNDLALFSVGPSQWRAADNEGARTLTAGSYRAGSRFTVQKAWLVTKRGAVESGPDVASPRKPQIWEKTNRSLE